MKSIENITNIMKAAAQKVWSFRIDFTVALWVKSFIRGMAEAVFSVQEVVYLIRDQLFPQTATGEFLELWGSWEGVTRKDGKVATGKVNFVGDTSQLGNNIPYGTLFQSSNGNVYETIESKNIQEVTIDVHNFDAIAGTATVTTDIPHNYASGMSVSLDITGLGVVEAENISVTGEKEFIFSIDLSSVTGATGTTTAIYANVEAQSQEFGTVQNLDAGTELTLIDSIDVGDTIYTEEAFNGGADEETAEDYRDRILLARRQIRGVFSEDQVKSAGLTVAGNDRIITDPPVPGTYDTPKVAGFQPRPGEVVVYVVRRDTDGKVVDSGSVPAEVLNDTKTAILEQGKLPANTPASWVYVFAVLKNEINLNLTISPDTATMREAVENAARAFFIDNVVFDAGGNINKLKSYLSDAYDYTTGTPVDSVIVNSYDDMSGENKKLMVLGDITYS